MSTGRRRTRRFLHIVALVAMLFGLVPPFYPDRAEAYEGPTDPSIQSVEYQGIPTYLILYGSGARITVVDPTKIRLIGHDPAAGVNLDAGVVVSPNNATTVAITTSGLSDTAIAALSTGAGPWGVVLEPGAISILGKPNARAITKAIGSGFSYVNPVTDATPPAIGALELVSSASDNNVFRFEVSEPASRGADISGAIELSVGGVSRLVSMAPPAASFLPYIEFAASGAAILKTDAVAATMNFTMMLADQTGNGMDPAGGVFNGTFVDSTIMFSEVSDGQATMSVAFTPTNDMGGLDALEVRVPNEIGLDAAWLGDTSLGGVPVLTAINASGNKLIRVTGGAAIGGVAQTLNISGVSLLASSPFSSVVARIRAVPGGQSRQAGFHSSAPTTGTVSTLGVLTASALPSVAMNPATLQLSIGLPSSLSTAASMTVTLPAGFSAGSATVSGPGSPFVSSTNPLTIGFAGSQTAGGTVYDIGGIGLPATGIYRIGVSIVDGASIAHGGADLSVGVTSLIGVAQLVPNLTNTTAATLDATIELPGNLPASSTIEFTLPTELLPWGTFGGVSVNGGTVAATQDVDGSLIVVELAAPLSGASARIEVGGGVLGAASGTFPIDFEVRSPTGELAGNGTLSVAVDSATIVPLSGTSIAVTPMEIGYNATATVSFTTGVAVPASGRLVLDFGTDFSAVGTTVLGPGSPFVYSASGGLVWITVPGGIASGSTVTFDLLGLLTPPAGGIFNVGVWTTAADGTTLQNATFNASVPPSAGGTAVSTGVATPTPTPTATFTPTATSTDTPTATLTPLPATPSVTMLTDLAASLAPNVAGSVATASVG
ncbi:MAG: hypothetical protein EPO26_18195, partial [Chloroflexota bacterium]